jgi:VWFA-related protein
LEAQEERMTVCRTATLFALFTTGASALAQTATPLPLPQRSPVSQNSGSAYNLKVTTTIVSLDIVVTDAKGKPVNGLKKDDFQIMEGNVPQTIRSFEAPETHDFPKNLAISSTAELDEKAPDAPVTVIVLDEANTTFTDEAFARYSIKKYLATQPEHLTQPTELVAIDITHLMVLRDYTTSKSQILHALDHHLQALPWHLTAGWEAEQFDQSFMALNEVAKAVAGHPGHKNMIWIGQGLPTLDLTQADASSLELIENAIEASTNQLRDSRITLYTVNPSGVAVETSTDINGNDSGSDPFGSSIDFNAMARATGGVAFYGRNDVDNLINESERDGNDFYTMTYRPESNDSPDKFRAIHVVVDRPGVIATTREGYYTQPADTPPVTLTAEQQKAVVGDDLVDASANQLVYDGVHVEIHRDPSNASKFILHLPASALDWQHDGAGPPITSISLLVATFDRKGKLIKRDAKILHVRARPVAPDAPDPSINLSTEVDTSNAARIRFVVRSGATGKIGAQNAPCVNGLCTPAM